MEKIKVSNPLLNKRSLCYSMQPSFLILMEKDYVNKNLLLKPKIYSSKLLIMNNTIAVTLIIQEIYFS